MLSNGQTPFCIACVKGYTDVACTLLDKGAGVNKLDGQGFTPLFLACRGGHGSVVTILLEKGADTKLQSMGGTPLYIACVFGHMDIIDALLAKGANPLTPNNTGYTPLMVAAEKGREEAVGRLLAHPSVTLEHLLIAHQQHGDAIQLATRNNHLGIVHKIQQKTYELLLEKGDIKATLDDGTTYLEATIRLGRADTVEKPLDMGAAPNQPGEVSPLHTVSPNMAIREKAASLPQHFPRENPKSFVDRVNVPSSDRGIGV